MPDHSSQQNPQAPHKKPREVHRPQHARLRTPRELEEEFGISRYFIYKAVKAGKLRPTYVGAHIRFEREKFLEQLQEPA